MENSNPIEQMKGFAEKKLRVLRENPDESGTKAYLAKMRKGVGKVPGADPVSYTHLTLPTKLEV